MKMRTLTFCLLLLLQQAFSYAQPCSGGSAGGFPCDNITLQSVMSVSTLQGSGDGNDIWGWTDPLNGKEYALIGVQNGTSFVDISSPNNPIVLGFLPTHSSSSSWRDIKVINNYAYIVSEASSHGMQIFDLTRLRSVASPPITFTVDGHITYGGGRSHNVVALEETGYIVAVGTSGYNNGGMTFFDVNNTPTAPSLAGAFTSDGYTHDAMCFVYRGPDKQYIGKEICIGYNTDTNTIIDATDKTNITQISRTPYTGSRYTHQGWVTDDHRYMLVNDELDESNNGHNTRTYIFDISNLDNPNFLGYYQHPLAAIDHNLYIKGRYAYLSNYRSGVRILDLGNIASGNLTEIAHFDTYVGSNSAQFNGTWSNYPFFKSGNVVVSDIEEGLFVIKPNFQHFSFTLDDIADGVVRLCPGTSTTFTVNIDAYNGFSDNVNLSLSGLDPTLTASLSSTSVAAGNQVTINLTAATGGTPACSGNFCVLLTGAGNNPNTEQSFALGIIIDDNLPTCMPTSACPTCDDGIQNQDEIAIDCGGATCPACPSTCDDGIQNQDETAIDCGGATCPACPCFGIPLSCGVPYNGDTNGSINDYTDYNGVTNTYPSDEVSFQYTQLISGPITIILSNMDSNLDMIIMDGCAPTTSNLIAEERTDGAANNEVYTNTNLPAGSYYIHVEKRSVRRSSTFTIEVSSCPSVVQLSPKVFLQGPLTGVSMSTSISGAALFPNISPYPDAKPLGGVVPTNAVDWVYVEIRSDNTATPATIHAQSAILLEDGTVTDTDGTSPLIFPATAGQNWYVVIKHHNHLGIMTNNPVLLN